MKSINDYRSLHQREYFLQPPTNALNILDDLYLGERSDYSTDRIIATGYEIQHIPITVNALDSLTNLIVLDLSVNRIKSIPKELFQCVSLHTLNLSHNEIHTIDPSIVHAKSLKVLNMNNNQLVRLPNELCCLNLQILKISQNAIEELPLSLGFMHTLEELEIGWNKLTDYPDSLICLELKNIIYAGNQVLPEETQKNYLINSFKKIGWKRVRKFHESPESLKCLVGVIHFGQNTFHLDYPESIDFCNKNEKFNVFRRLKSLFEADNEYHEDYYMSTHELIIRLISYFNSNDHMINFFDCEEETYDPIQHLMNVVELNESKKIDL